MSRGQYILVATDDGDWREDEKSGHGENYGTSEDRQATEERHGWTVPSCVMPSIAIRRPRRAVRHVRERLRVGERLV